MSLIIGILVLLFCLWPTLNAIKTGKKLVQNAVRDMHVEEHSLTIEYTFKEKRIEITATQNDTVQNETLMIKNVTNLKVEKNGVGICVGDDMYYIENDDIVSGTRQMLLRIFKNAGFEIKPSELTEKADNK